MLAAAEKVRPSDAWIWQRFITGLWLSGLRLGEALELSWDYEAPFHIDLTGKRPVFVIRAAAQKSRRDEILPMTPDFAEWLEATFPEGEREGKVFGMRGKMHGGFHCYVSNRQEGGNRGSIERKISLHRPMTCGGHSAPDGQRRLQRPYCSGLCAMPAFRQPMSYYVNIDATDIADGLWGNV